MKKNIAPVGSKYSVNGFTFEITSSREILHRVVPNDLRSTRITRVETILVTAPNGNTSEQTVNYWTDSNGKLVHVS